MANDRLYLRCPVCHEYIMMAKVIGIEPYIWKEDALAEFIQDHREECLVNVAEDSPRFEVINEDVECKLQKAKP